MGRLTYRDNNGIADLKMTSLKDPCEYCQNAIEKLAHLEDLEEQGRLIELPCALGDTVYDIAGKEIRKQIVDGIEYMVDGFFIYANEDEWLGRLGDLVFLTREEAEAKLAEMRGAE